VSIVASEELPTPVVWLLYEAAPLALVAEAAGARASTGRGRILDVVATDYHQRTPLYIGSAQEVTWAERSHQEVPE
jgi:fructose-1,6-bisphosphatase